MKKMILLMLAFLTISSSSFALELDLETERTCKVVKFVNAPYLLASSKVRGRFAHIIGSDKLSFNDLINDNMIYFSIDPLGDPSEDYTWRYKGKAILVKDEKDFAIFEGNSVIGKMYIRINNQDEKMQVIYSLKNNNFELTEKDFLFSLECDR